MLCGRVATLRTWDWIGLGNGAGIPRFGFRIWTGSTSVPLFNRYLGEEG